MNNRTDNRRTTKPEPDFHGAAIIDEHGREIPITEDMVQRACRKLDNVWYFPASHGKAHPER